MRRRQAVADIVLAYREDTGINGDKFKPLGKWRFDFLLGVNKKAAEDRWVKGTGDEGIIKMALRDWPEQSLQGLFGCQVLSNFFC